MAFAKNIFYKLYSTKPHTKPWNDNSNQSQVTLGERQDTSWPKSHFLAKPACLWTLGRNREHTNSTQKGKPGFEPRTVPYHCTTHIIITLFTMFYNNVTCALGYDMSKFSHTESITVKKSIYNENKWLIESRLLLQSSPYFTVMCTSHKTVKMCLSPSSISKMLCTFIDPHKKRSVAAQGGKCKVR